MHHHRIALPTGFLLLFLGMVGALAPMPAHALVIMDVEHTCPLNGEKFTAPTALSGTSFGRRLDLREIGPIASPWPMPTCPGSGFPLFEDEFTDAELAKLKAFVATADYRQLIESNTTYYVVARLQALLGQPPMNIAFSLLAACWEAEGDSTRYARYLDETLVAFHQVLPSLEPDQHRQRARVHFLTVELNRQLGRFDIAADLLRAAPASLPDHVPAEFIALEQKLIAEKNATPAAPGQDRQDQKISTP